jgi:arylsulfatase A
MHHMRLLILLLLCVTPVIINAGDKPPNIVFILADDLGVNDLGCYGRADHQTPHVDQLAKEGMRFTCAYAAQSVCSPTRAAILTGQAPARLHLTTFLPGRGDASSQLLLHPKINQVLPKEAATLAERLKSVGYTSAMVGKWHLGGKPTDRGFALYHPGQANTKPSETEGGKGEFDLTQVAEKFIEEHQQKPFFLYLCHNNPHITFDAQKPRIARFHGSFNPTYAAVIETLDDAVGRITRKLAELNLAENTILIFTSDNGGLHVLEGGTVPTHNSPYRAGKGFLYEGGIRIPLIVRWPGKVPAGTTSDVPVISTDWTPTLLAAASVPSSGDFDGVDLSSIFFRNTPPKARALFWHQPHYMNQGSKPSGAIRDGAWKLIEDYETGYCELFNLTGDVKETTDVSAREPARVAEMRGKLEKWRREVGAQRNSPNPAFNFNLWTAAYGTFDVTRMRLEKESSQMLQVMKPWREAMSKPMAKNAPVGYGVIFLEPDTARLHGEKFRHEPEPHKDTLGYWAVQSDWVEWTFQVPTEGTYSVELLQAAGKNSGGAEVEVAIGDKKLAHTVKETGHFQRFVPFSLGMIRLEKGEHTLTIKAKSKPGFGVMDLRRVVIRGVGR